MKIYIAVFAISTLTTLFAGCSNQETEPGEIGCPAIRGEVCTMQYDPVCGRLANGESKTYSSDCVACSDTKVTGYTKGACKS